MRRIGPSLALAAVLLSIGTPTAVAHPLGNFSVNHLSKVRVSSDRVDVAYTLDQAEIPTFRERGEPRDALTRRKTAEIARGLHLTVDGQPTALVPVGRPRLAFPAGQGGLTTTRLEVALRAAVRDPSRVVLQDRTYEGRVGWKAVVAAPGEGTAVRSDVPSTDPTGGLRRYPASLLSSPLDERDAAFAVRGGDGTLVAPEGPGGPQRTTRNRAGDGFAGVFERAAAGQTALVFLLLASLLWGALHALSPGHGKAMVAAYLVGTRGTARQAVVLGGVVTITHTIGVFALGLVTLALSQYILPEDLYPWLGLVSGLLVVVIGAGVLRSRVRTWRATEDHHHHHHEHSHSHSHSHAPPERLTSRSLLGMGAAAGLIPCPSALVVLLAAIAQHQVVLGLALILTFSLGLAITLTALGLAVVSAPRVAPRLRLPSGTAAAVSAGSALIIVAAGCLLTAQAVPALL